MSTRMEFKSYFMENSCELATQARKSFLCGVSADRVVLMASRVMFLCLSVVRCIVIWKKSGSARWSKCSVITCVRWSRRTFHEQHNYGAARYVQHHNASPSPGSRRLHCYNLPQFEILADFRFLDINGILLGTAKNFSRIFKVISGKLFQIWC